jgi:hypothetical protein
MSANENQSPQKQSKEVRNEGINSLIDCQINSPDQKNRFLYLPFLLETNQTSDQNNTDIEIIQAISIFDPISE